MKSAAAPFQSFAFLYTHGTATWFTEVLQSLLMLPGTRWSFLSAKKPVKPVHICVCHTERSSVVPLRQGLVEGG